MRTLIAPLAAMLAFASLAPTVAADEVCQPVAEAGVTACVETTGDPATGSFGATARAGLLHVCVVVFATCPEALP